MMRVTPLCVLCGFFLWSVAAVALSEPAGEMVGDARAGQRKAQVCIACHGADGNSPSPQWPRLAAQHASYLARQLHDYRTGRRINAQMNAMVTNLGDQDIADLAAWFSSLEAKSNFAVDDKRLLEIGAHIYRAGNAQSGVPACIGCHGPGGKGNPAAVYPVLSGQYADYTRQQLLAYRSGARDNDPDSVMRSIAARLTDIELKAVSIYISGLH